MGVGLGDGDVGGGGEQVEVDEGVDNGFEASVSGAGFVGWFAGWVCFGAGNDVVGVLLGEVMFGFLAVAA